MYSLFHWFPSWHIRAALFSIFLIFSLLVFVSFVCYFLHLLLLFFYAVSFTSSTASFMFSGTMNPNRRGLGAEWRDFFTHSYLIFVVAFFPSLFLPFRKKRKKDNKKAAPVFIDRPTKLCAPVVCYTAGSVGRASFVTIRHIPFRFRTARSTNNNNKNERERWIYMYKMAFLPCIYVASCSLAAAATTTVPACLFSLSPVGLDTVKNRCRAVYVGIAPTLSLWLSGGSSTKRTSKTIQGGLKASCFSLTLSVSSINVKGGPQSCRVPTAVIILARWFDFGVLSSSGRPSLNDNIPHTHTLSLSLSLSLIWRQRLSPSQFLSPRSPRVYRFLICWSLL